MISLCRGLYISKQILHKATGLFRSPTFGLTDCKSKCYLSSTTERQPTDTQIYWPIFTVLVRKQHQHIKYSSELFTQQWDFLNETHSCDVVVVVVKINSWHKQSDFSEVKVLNNFWIQIKQQLLISMKTTCDKVWEKKKHLSVYVHPQPAEGFPGLVRTENVWRQSAVWRNFHYMIGTESKTTHGGCSSAVAFIINNGHQTLLLMNYKSQGVGIQRAGKA